MTAPGRVRCPTCRREAAWEANPNRPFCSERCRVVDLGNWADERYRIPSTEPGEDPTNGRNGERGAGDGEPEDP